MKYTAFLCLIFSLTSCEYKPCVNTNAIFDKHTPYELPYRTEIIQQLRDTSNGTIEYDVEQYLQQGGREYLLIHCVGKHLCANAWMQINEWGRIKDIKRTKGMGYHGAGLAGLQYIIDDTAKILVYQDADYIID